MSSSSALFNDSDQRLLDTTMKQLREAKSDRPTTQRQEEELRVRIVRRKQTLMDLMYVKAVSGHSSAYF